MPASDAALERLERTTAETQSLIREALIESKAVTVEVSHIKDSIERIEKDGRERIQRVEAEQSKLDGRIRRLEQSPAPMFAPGGAVAPAQEPEEKARTRLYIALAGFIAALSGGGLVAAARAIAGVG